MTRCRFWRPLWVDFGHSFDATVNFVAMRPLNLVACNLTPPVSQESGSKSAAKNCVSAYS
jgi:hypothetical protein